MLRSMYASLGPILRKEVLDTVGEEELALELYSIMLLKCARNGEIEQSGAVRGALAAASLSLPALGMSSSPWHLVLMTTCNKAPHLVFACLTPRWQRTTGRPLCGTACYR